MRELLNRLWQLSKRATVIAVVVAWSPLLLPASALLGMAALMLAAPVLWVRIVISFVRGLLGEDRKPAVIGPDGMHGGSGALAFSAVQTKNEGTEVAAQTKSDGTEVDGGESVGEDGDGEAASAMNSEDEGWHGVSTLRRLSYGGGAPVEAASVAETDTRGLIEGEELDQLYGSNKIASDTSRISPPSLVTEDFSDQIQETSAPHTSEISSAPLDDSHQEQQEQCPPNHLSLDSRDSEMGMTEREDHLPYKDESVSHEYQTSEDQSQGTEPPPENLILREDQREDEQEKQKDAENRKEMEVSALDDTDTPVELVFPPEYHQQQEKHAAQDSTEVSAFPSELEEQICFEDRSESSNTDPDIIQVQETDSLPSVAEKDQINEQGSSNSYKTSLDSPNVQEKNNFPSVVEERIHVQDGSESAKTELDQTQEEHVAQDSTEISAFPSEFGEQIPLENRSESSNADSDIVQVQETDSLPSVAEKDQINEQGSSDSYKTSLDSPKVQQKKNSPSVVEERIYDQDSPQPTKSESDQTQEEYVSQDSTEIAAFPSEIREQIPIESRPEWSMTDSDIIHVQEKDSLPSEVERGQINEQGSYRTSLESPKVQEKNSCPSVVEEKIRDQDDSKSVKTEFDQIQVQERNLLPSEAESKFHSQDGLKPAKTDSDLIKVQPRSLLPSKVEDMSHEKDHSESPKIESDPTQVQEGRILPSEAEKILDQDLLESIKKGSDLIHMQERNLVPSAEEKNHDQSISSEEKQESKLLKLQKADSSTAMEDFPKLASSLAELDSKNQESKKGSESKPENAGPFGDSKTKVFEAERARELEKDAVTIKKILIGDRGPSQGSLMLEVENLYNIMGIQLPRSESPHVGDIEYVASAVEILKNVIGVKV